VQKSFQSRKENKIIITYKLKKLLIEDQIRKVRKKLNIQVKSKVVVIVRLNQSKKLKLHLKLLSNSIPLVPKIKKLQ
jgi:hypothetical protein